MFKSAPAELQGQKSTSPPSSMAGFGRWSHPLSSATAVGALAGSNATWRALARPRPGSRADELQARCGAATGKELQQAGRHMLSPRACVMGEIGETALTT